ncbi:putative lipid II flippase FtsW [Oceanibaculum pacificum]|uniref:Probable peptidoglycan glycosyltransferase FtsW n=1 Tax=Oceanibaculum pacificum TaxID=580166 RepID=A0A154W0F4_9PROT|nr:putative lipid II flippase FtsW [Oceanibaculum pacificum]KZD07005.1 cell division protein FtsW [Oceanibaculum pacificum]
MSALSRTDTSAFGRWWWTIDRWSLAAIGLIIGFGALMTLAASPPVAERIGLDQFYFVRRHFALLPVGITLLIGVSLLAPQQVRRLAVLGLLISIAMLVAVLFVGGEIKGARRWINLAGFSLQPSEFVKPFFAVVAAWMFAEWRKGEGFPGHLVALAMYGLIAGLLLLQPDLGQAVVVSAIFFGQFFLAGMPIIWIVGAIVLGVTGLIGAYFTLDHVASRIDRFLDPGSGDSYQVDRSLEAFMNGGLFGRGPGEGTVKAYIPDAHADFIFAVAGEELGLLACLLVVTLFTFVVLRGFARVLGEQSLYVMLAAAGLLAQFGVQALINMGSTLHLIPTKGMTLPFVSYGGSSLLALSVGMGMALALTRRRVGRGGSR